MSWAQTATTVLLPVFVALSPLTVLPMFLAMTDGMSVTGAKGLARRAVLTALVVAVLVVLAGEAVFRVLSITFDDLRVAGGVILLVLAVYDLIFTRERRQEADLDEDPGIVPLGVPIIVGPATMTTCLVLADEHGKTLVFFSLALNLAIMALMLHYARPLSARIPASVTRAFGKVMSLFLAAIAVAMFRRGAANFGL